MEALAGVNQISATRVSKRGNTPREALFPLLFPLRAGQAEPTMEER